VLAGSSTKHDAIRNLRTCVCLHNPRLPPPTSSISNPDYATFFPQFGPPDRSSTYVLAFCLTVVKKSGVPVTQCISNPAPFKPADPIVRRNHWRVLEHGTHACAGGSPYVHSRGKPVRLLILVHGYNGSLTSPRLRILFGNRIKFFHRPCFQGGANISDQSADNSPSNAPHFHKLTTKRSWDC
jgi:hypothetical protein